MSPTIQNVDIAYAFSRSEGVGMQQVVPIMHVHPYSTLQNDEDTTAAVVACLEQGLVGLDNHLQAASLISQCLRGCRYERTYRHTGIAQDAECAVLCG